jgi:hypothetical protein
VLRREGKPPRATISAGEGSGGDAEGGEEVASTAELHREEAKVEERRAADLAAPSAAGRGGEVGGEGPIR